ncbi:MAG: ankyrin repeat domain-containing protein [Spirochaetales bacterium]|nr:ankyrin repeat domain-containing protein [Spirochaetales bacterium]
MKITVLISPSKRNSIVRLKDFLEKRYISASFYFINSEWSLNGEMELVKILRESYDFLIFCDQDELNSRWIPYITGYSQERGKEVLRRINLIFFLNDIQKVPLPRWLKHFPLVHSFAALNRYIHFYESNWHRLDDMLAADRFLEIIGHSNLKMPIFVGDSEKDLMLLELYIERGGSPNHVDENGVPLICEIIRKDETILAFHLLQRDCDVNMASRDRGTTPLMEAASAGKKSLVRAILEKGADLDRASKEGQTALILAIGNRHDETAKILLDAGAEPSHKDSLGMTALKYAQLYGFNELVEILEAADGE